MQAAEALWRVPLDQSDAEWVVAYAGVDPAVERVRETLCTLGNGYLATRGAAPEVCMEVGADTGVVSAGDGHYPGTYVAGIYNRLASRIHGHPEENESLVNLPNWLMLGWRTDRSGWVTPDGPEIQEYQQRLDLRTGLLWRRYRHLDAAGRATTVISTALVSMAEPHLAALEVTFVPENWSGTLRLRSGIDGRVANRQTPEYESYAGRHLQPDGQDQDRPGQLWLRMRTNQSRIEIAVATRTRISTDAQDGVVLRRTTMAAAHPEENYTVSVRQGEPVRVEKVAAYYTSRDRAISEPVEAAQHAVVRAGPFEVLCAAHARAWRQLWERCHVELKTEAGKGEPEDGPAPTLSLNLHTFHLAAVASPNVVGLDVSVGARGLHGEDYRGHVFWDELFIHRFLALHLPEVSRGLLLYRWRRLDAAREAAAENGHRGAMYPWESGSDGREATPSEIFHPHSGRWERTFSSCERHVGLAIGYDLWQYYQATDDREFLRQFGAEMIIEIARFFADLAKRNEQTGRYEITGVMGPDEFHTAHPGARAPGLRNNAYTNVMTVWLLRRALDVVDLLMLEMDEQELARWRDITTHMYVPFHDDGIISQFDGYGELAEFDFATYSARCDGQLSRVDEVLESEGDSPNNYQLGKQADVVMLLYLLSAEELRDLLGDLGYHWPGSNVPRTVRYYLDRVVHGSSLSRVVYAWVQARTDRAASWECFTEALAADIGETQHTSTREGVHLGAMGGTLDLAERCYLGVETRQDALWFNPQLPEEISKLHTLLNYRGHQIHVTATQRELILAALPSGAAPVTLHPAGHEPVRLAGGQEVTVRHTSARKQ